MIYPFMTLDDGAEIVHSEMKDNGQIQIHIEKPDEKECFFTATCFLPGYHWEGVTGFSEKDIQHYEKVIRDNERQIIRNATGV